MTNTALNSSRMAAFAFVIVFGAVTPLTTWANNPAKVAQVAGKAARAHSLEPSAFVKMAQIGPTDLALLDAQDLFRVYAHGSFSSDTQIKRLLRSLQSDNKNGRLGFKLSETEIDDVVREIVEEAGKGANKRSIQEIYAKAFSAKLEQAMNEGNGIFITLRPKQDPNGPLGRDRIPYLTTEEQIAEKFESKGFVVTHRNAWKAPDIMVKNPQDLKKLLKVMESDQTAKVAQITGFRTVVNSDLDYMKHLANLQLERAQSELDRAKKAMKALQGRSRPRSPKVSEETATAATGTGLSAAQADSKSGGRAGSGW